MAQTPFSGFLFVHFCLLMCNFNIHLCLLTQKFIVCEDAVYSKTFPVRVKMVEKGCRAYIFYMTIDCSLCEKAWIVVDWHL